MAKKETTLIPRRYGRDPFALMRAEFDRFFNEPAWTGLHFPNFRFGRGDEAAWNPGIDIFEKDNRLFTKVDLPGLKKEDIKIEVTGVRPGERLNEILFARNEPIAKIGIDGIVAAKPSNPSVEAMRGWLATLEQGLARDDTSSTLRTRASATASRYTRCHSVFVIGTALAPRPVSSVARTFSGCPVATADSIATRTR